MRLELMGFQEEAATEVLERLTSGIKAYRATRGDKRPQRQAFALSSVTGSGKTVIAATVLEALLRGSTSHEIQPVEGLAVLWVTYDPALGQQSKNLIARQADRLAPSTLKTIDSEAFAQRKLDPGNIYFLSLPLLGGSNLLTRPGDGRPFTFWDTLANTVADENTTLLVVVDEAHIGMGGHATGAKARSILARVIGGDEASGYPGAPLTWGISATPGRFDANVKALVPGSSGANVVIKPIDVQESGLLKQAVSLYTPAESVSMAETMLDQAMAELRSSTAEWKRYCDDAGEKDAVVPLLVFQLPNRDDAGSLRAENEFIRSVVRSARTGLKDFSSKNIAHVIADRADIKVGSIEIKKIAPEDVAGREMVRILIVKDAVSTGWDCPRAEILVSMRTFHDPTAITQMLGRMVRTPLARATGIERLDRVSCWVPRFDVGTAVEVVQILTGEKEPDGRDKAAMVVDVNPRTYTLAGTEESSAEGEEVVDPVDAGELDLSMEGDDEDSVDESAGDDDGDDDHDGGAIVAQADGGAVDAVNAADADDQNDVAGDAAGTAIPVAPAQPSGAGGAVDGAGGAGAGVNAEAQADADLDDAEEVDDAEAEAGETEEEAEDPVDRELLAAAVAAIEALPAQTLPNTKMPPIKRLDKVALILSTSGLRTNAVKQVEDQMVACIEGQARERQTDVAAARKQVLTVEQERVDSGFGVADTVTKVNFEAGPDVIEAEFKAADRTLGGLAKAVYDRRFKELYTDDGEVDVDALRADVAALGNVPDLVAAVRARAGKLADELLLAHVDDIALQTGAVRDELDELLAQSDVPQPRAIRLPARQHHMTSGTRHLPKHIYGDERGRWYVPGTLNRWEQAVLGREVARDAVVGWYRNPGSAGKASLSIAYRGSDDLWHLVQPDFLFVERTSNGELKVAIVDPHWLRDEQGLARLAALAKYAEDNADLLSRVNAVGQVGGGPLRRLRLEDSRVRAAVRGAASVRELFADDAVADEYPVDSVS